MSAVGGKIFSASDIVNLKSVSSVSLFERLHILQDVKRRHCTFHLSGSLGLTSQKPNTLIFRSW